MSTTPLVSLADAMKPPVDSTWEYLDNTVRVYTIDLINQYRNACLLAVNPNIIHFHDNVAGLNSWIETILNTINRVEPMLAPLHAKHAGRAGYALGSGDVQQFLAINEEYVLVQSELINVYNDFFLPLFNSNERAHAAAVAAQNQQKEGQ
jgi:hypothetical protein